MKHMYVRIYAIGLSMLLGLIQIQPAVAQTTLANQPVFANTDIPGNLALALSVEFPTAISVANLGDYNDAQEYLGYFDPQKCYNYIYNAGTPSSSYFQPVNQANGSNNHSCSQQWSGNFMNWAAMPTIDPFRWALTGGFRSVDTPTLTILEKAWGSAQGSVGSNYPYRGSKQGGGNRLNQSLIQSVTPFDQWGDFDSAIWGNGNTMVFSGKNAYTLGTSSPLVMDLSNVAAANTNFGENGAYRVYVRVKVCDASLGVGMLEGNCVQYGNNYKPEGLLQQYSSKIRFSAFGYLNQNGDVRQGGVMRAPMGFIGPTYPLPLSSTLVTNTRPEWDPTTGVMSPNPDTASATASGVTQSGVMNYLNKFGEFGHTYRTYDTVGELYYAIARYYENLGNVPEWTNGANSTALDGFPAVTTWTGVNAATNAPNDPILYSCQKNFILGIGDDHTWFDYNVGGNTNDLGSRPMPPAVANDTLNKASLWTTNLEQLEGMPLTPVWPIDSGATYFLAGLAYGVHVNDIRPDLPGAQTISTYWMDVAEGQRVENLNMFYLGSKYGGFSSATINALPANATNGPVYDMLTPLNANNKQWDTTGLNINMNGNVHPLPDHYFVAGNAQAMVTGLQSAFTSIAHAVSAFTTSFSFSAPNVTSSGTESFASSYTSKDGWSGTINASTLSFDMSGNPVATPLWTTDTSFQAQVAGNGWQTARNIATWDPITNQGVAFEAGSINASQLSALAPSGCANAVCEAQFLSYLRGDQTNEVGSTAVGSTQSLRARTLVLGDIVNAGLTPVGTPIQTFSDTTNPSYAAFKTHWTSTTPRPTMVYAGGNDGMLHGFLGSNGVEQFAYVPSALFLGPNNTPQVDGLAQLGNPNYLHHFYVDATPYAFDIDFGHTGGTTGAPDWHTVLIGGLGKGGKSYYAIDITDPSSMTSESIVKSKVLWEFSDPTMGYSYGAPVVAKTAKYGWVVVLTSGYDNSDGFGYLYFVNPKTGALLEKVKTATASIGLTQASAFVKDYSDDTSDSIYVGDLQGQLWRFDITGMPAVYPAPLLFATLLDPSGVPQKITSAPLIEIHPVTRRRYVMVGTGKLLASGDIITKQMQTFYSFLDGTAAGFSTAGTFPITRSALTPVATANLTTINTLPAATQGWYTDLGLDASGIGWRVIINPQAYNGIVSFTTLLTLTNDACNPQGQSRVYALDYATATSVLQPTSLPYVSYGNSVIDVRFAGANGNPEIIVGFSQGNPPYARVPANLTGSLATRILNWREVPTVE